MWRDDMFGLMLIKIILAKIFVNVMFELQLNFFVVVYLALLVKVIKMSMCLDS